MIIGLLFSPKQFYYPEIIEIWTRCSLLPQLNSDTRVILQKDASSRSEYIL
jgi:hypothetical protein